MQVPLPVAVGDPADPVIAECHFAEERWSGAVPGPASGGGP
jgi:hypothetical protein